MSVFTVQDFQDLVRSTLKDLGRNKFVNLAHQLQHYEVMSRILNKERVAFRGGAAIQFNVLGYDAGIARNVGLFEEDTTVINDQLSQGSIPWRHSHAAWAYERREPLMNRGESKIVDEVDMRRRGNMIKLAKLMEANFWTKPESSSDKTSLWGLPMACVKYPASNPEPGFFGGNPSGFSGGYADIDSNVLDQHRNYTARYANVTRTDLIDKMRIGARRTTFESPVDIADYRRGRGNRNRYYLNLNTITKLERVAEEQNQNLGMDLASMDGVTTIRRIPLVWIPYLDADTTDPVYQVNWNCCQVSFLTGDYLVESDPMISPKVHNAVEVHTDLTYNFTFYNRRELAVFSK